MVTIIVITFMTTAKSLSHICICGSGNIRISFTMMKPKMLISRYRDEKKVCECQREKIKINITSSLNLYG